MITMCTAVLPSKSPTRPYRCRGTPERFLNWPGTTVHVPAPCGCFPTCAAEKPSWSRRTREFRLLPIRSIRVEVDRAPQADSRRSGTAQRPAARDSAAQADRAASLRQRRTLVSRVRTAGDLAGPIRGRPVVLSLQPLDRGRGRVADAGGGRLLPAERPCLSQRGRRLRDRLGQPRPECRADSRQCSVRGLRADRRGVRVLRSRLPRVAGRLLRPASGAGRPAHCSDLDVHELARRPRIRNRLLDPDLCVHGGRLLHARVGVLPGGGAR
jgi:hypothetical protein